MNKKVHFGKNFNIDATNRMEILSEQDLPKYIDLSRQAREKLQNTISDLGWPERPENLESIEGLFLAAKNEVDQRWRDRVLELVGDSIKDWQKKVPVNKENKELLAVLSDPEKVEKALTMRQLGILEKIRPILPEAWRSLVMLSSERQLASVVLLNHWYKELPDTEIEKLGINKEELHLMLNFAGILGKYIDHAYLKQIELADLPGGSSATKLGEEEGSIYIYDLYRRKEKGDIELKPYSDVFPLEWPRLVTRIKVLAQNVSRLLEQNKLSSKYQGLPEYLLQMAKVYGSKELDLKKLDDAWTELYELSDQLVEDGCPVMLIAQGTAIVAGDANKVDAEIRLSFRTPEALEIEKQFGNIRNIAQTFLNKARGSKREHVEIPKPRFSFQPYAFGPNLAFFATAESNEKIILAHTNAMQEVALMQEKPLAEKILGKKLNDKEYRQAALTCTVAHEIGHTFMDKEEDEVKDRIGTDSQSWILEELKAETIGLKLIFEAVKLKKAKIELEEILEAEIGVISSCIKDYPSTPGSLGERYYYYGIAIVHNLLTSGALRKTASGYEIVDVNLAFKSLSELADEVLSLFTDQHIKKEKVENYIFELKNKAKDKQVKVFIADLTK